MPVKWFARARHNVLPKMEGILSSSLHVETTLIIVQHWETKFHCWRKSLAIGSVDAGAESCVIVWVDFGTGFVIEKNNLWTSWIASPKGFTAIGFRVKVRPRNRRYIVLVLNPFLLIKLLLSFNVILFNWISF